MANKKKQFRKSVSFKPDVFAAVDRHCKLQGESVASFIEDAVRNKLALYGVELPSRDEAIGYLAVRFPLPEPPSFEDVISGVRML